MSRQPLKGWTPWSFRRAKHAVECKRSTIGRGHVSGLWPPGSENASFLFNLFSKSGQNQNRNLWNFAIRRNAGLSLFNICRKGPEEPKRPWRADYIAFQTELFVSVAKDAEESYSEQTYLDEYVWGSSSDSGLWQSIYITIFNGWWCWCLFKWAWTQGLPSLHIK